MKIRVDGYDVNIYGDKCAYDISRPDIGVSIHGAGCSFETSRSGTVGPYRLEPESETKKNGGGEINYTAGESRVRLNFEALDGGVVINMDVKSDDALGRICPLIVEGEESGTTLGGDVRKWRFMRTGYQSWSPSGSLGLMESEPFPPLNIFVRNAMHPSPAFRPRAGLHHVDWATVIYNPDNGKCILMGFLSARKYLSVIELEVAGTGGRRLELRALNDAEMAVPRKNEPLFSCDKLWVAMGDDPHELWERYLDLAGKEMGARIPDETPVGWCSWYHYFTKVSERDMRQNLKVLSNRKEDHGVKFVQLDDGYCKPGDWFDWNRKFPVGLDKLAGEISNEGFTPGLWIAPFICTRSSRIYRERNDMLLKDASGKKVMSGLNPMWSGVAYYPFDLTNPKAIDYVEEVMTSAREWGFEYIKIDFVYAALLRGKRHDPTATGVEAYRTGVETIRKALGDDIFLLGCGAPLLPSVGLVDGMRVSADVAPKWRDIPLRIITRAPFEPSCENAIHGTVCRAAMHRRLWLNDPDCLMVRKKNSKLTIEEVQSLATAIFLSAGMMLVSDNMAQLEEERWDIFKAATPSLPSPARPLDLFDEPDPSILHYACPDSDRHLAALINWSDRRAELNLDPANFGIKGPVHTFEYWTRNYSLVGEGDKPSFKLEPHSCAFFTIVPATGEPRLLSVTFHMGQGAVGTVREKLNARHLTVDFEMEGHRRGLAYAAFEKWDEPANVEVDFTGEGKIKIPLK